MAQRVVTLLDSDLSGADADETVTFALDGVSYEIDLTEKEAAKFRDSLGTYVSHARKTGGRRRRGGGTRGSAGEDTAAIREWAQQQGYEVSDRGRIPADVREAYQQAH